jgi:hypothetical protein
MKMLDGFIGYVLSNEVESRHHIFGMFRRSRQEQLSAHVCALIICVGNFDAGFGTTLVTGRFTDQAQGRSIVSA